MQTNIFLRIAGGVIGLTCVMYFFFKINAIIALPLFILGIVLLIVGAVKAQKTRV